MVCTDDLGVFVKEILLNFDAYRNRILTLVGDILSLEETAAVMNEHLSPIKFTDPKASNL